MGGGEGVRKTHMLYDNMIHMCTAGLTTTAITSSGSKVKEPAMNAIAAQRQRDGVEKQQQMLILSHRQLFDKQYAMI